jgi:hypothetical protein
MDGRTSSFGDIVDVGADFDEFEGRSRKKLLSDDVGGRQCVRLYFSNDLIKVLDPVRESCGSPSYHIRNAISVPPNAGFSASEEHSNLEKVLCLAECHSSRNVG